MILACVVKLWPGVEKCWSTGIESCFLESERWLFIRRLVAGSLFSYVRFMIVECAFDQIDDIV